VEASGTNEPPAATPETPAAGGMNAEGRKATLDAALQRAEADGWRVESRTDLQATLAKGKKLNTTLHLILTIVTVGIWGIVWFILWITGGIKHRLITVDEYGGIVDSAV
jgi:hypothetical protein